MDDLAMVTEGKASLNSRERRILRRSAQALFVHDPSIQGLEDLAEHPAISDSLRLLPEYTLQKWADEDDWHAKRSHSATNMRHHLQSIVGDAHLKRQRDHIERMASIFNQSTQQLKTLRPKSWEQVAQLRLRALELIHAWEGDLMRANMDLLPNDRTEGSDYSRQKTAIDDMTDDQVRGIFNTVLQQEGSD